MRRIPGAFILSLVLLLGLAGCSAGDEGGAARTVDRDTLTRREKDSIVAQSRIPGAGAVGRALGASDLARDRTEAFDSLQGY